MHHFACRHFATRGIQAVFVIDRLIVAAVVAPEGLAEIRVIADTQRRRHHVAEFLHFAIREQLLQRREEAVYLGAQAYSYVEIKHVIESRRGVHRQLLRLVVPVTVGAHEIHSVTQVDVRRDIQVFE